ACLGGGEAVRAVDQGLQGIVHLQARLAAVAALLRELLGGTGAQYRGVGGERVVPALIRLGILGARAQGAEAAGVGRRLDTLEAVGGLGSVRARGPGALERGACLIETTGAERGQALAGGPRIAVFAEGGIGGGGCGGGGFRRRLRRRLRGRGRSGRRRRRCRR